MNETTDLNASDTALSDKEMLRYARQILLDGWDIDAQVRLKNACVLIVGAGGLGCPLAETLVRAGAGMVYIVDDDCIDESNLQRQSLFTPSDVGQSKAWVAQQKLQQINDFCQIFAYQTRLTLDTYQQIDFFHLQSKNSTNRYLICDCTDNFTARDHINQIAVGLKLPLLSASAIAQVGQLALFEAYLDMGCYHCLFAASLSATKTDTNTQNCTQNCVTSGVLASTTQIMGNLQAQVALTFLGLGKNSLAQTLLLWQGQTISLRKLKYKKDEHCPVCSKMAW
ncbi:UBA/THIF-type NAD/FAD binding protein [Moraxella macacae 0408225]|uniref:UBA/THIF-type NAD/FAD binding protein n=1 Tax=Moraxella macacae 0408225 TaxID=1230338 RepID=L2F5C7_9GAMM|nr:HesA/MoeB/ThiF family protein [Moraxella macacae]ELA08259.1 UBA/THIF-type NAD/FAD binding protein [Moraxella macacae 0408225]